MPRRRHKGILSDTTFHQRLSVYALSLLVSLPPQLVGVAYAELIADPNAPLHLQPQIGQSGNGTPLVNIAPVHRDGISHNQYDDFNVDKRGLIFNNATEAGTSQIGGQVGANARLGGQSAQVILNEVTSTRNSDLIGLMEVFGPQANVIIANPNGITCDGCGFINTGKATLTTGVPTYTPDGDLAFEVRQGAITIEEGGLYGDEGATRLDNADLIARHLNVWGEVVVGEQLSLLAGTNDVRYQTDGSLEYTPAAGGSAPAMAIDASQYGAMRAGDIQIMSTEAGAGVKVHGYLGTDAGDLFVESQGDLSVRNADAGEIALNAAGDLEQLWKVHAEESTDIQANTYHSAENAELTAKDRVAVTTQIDQTHRGEVSADEVDLQSRGNLTIEGQAESIEEEEDGNAQVVARKHLNLDAEGDLTLRHAEVDARTVTGVQAGGMLRMEDSHLRTVNDLTTQSTDVVLDENATLNAVDKGLTVIATGQVDNAGRLLGQYVSIEETAELINRGEITAADSLSVEADTLENTESGTLQSAGAQTLTTSEAFNAGAIQSQTDLAIRSINFTNDTDATVSAYNVAISTDETLTNRGELSAESQLVLQENETGTTINEGQISSADGLFIQGLNFQQLAESQTSAKNRVDITVAGEFANNGDITAGQNIRIAANQGHNQTEGAISVERESVEGTDAIQLTGTGSGQAWTNRGDIFSNGNIRIDAADFSHLDVDGTISSEGVLTLISSNAIDNRSLLRARQINIQANTLKNGEVVDDEGGQIWGKEAVSVTHTGGVTNQGEILAGEAETAGQLTIQAATALGESGSVVDVTNTVGGFIQSTGALNIQGKSALINAGDIRAIEAIRIDNQNTTNSGGMLVAGSEPTSELSIQTKGAIKNMGNLVSYADIAITSTSGNVRNGKKAVAANDLYISAENIRNITLDGEDQAVMFAGGLFDLHAEQKIVNRHAIIESHGEGENKVFAGSGFYNRHAQETYYKETEIRDYKDNRSYTDSETKQNDLGKNRYYYWANIEFIYDTIRHKSPSQINVEGDLVLQGTNLVNIGSQIDVGGDLVLDGGSLDNRSQEEDANYYKAYYYRKFYDRPNHWHENFRDPDNFFAGFGSPNDNLFHPVLGDDHLTVFGESEPYVEKGGEYNSDTTTLPEIEIPFSELSDFEISLFRMSPYHQVDDEKEVVYTDQSITFPIEVLEPVKTSKTNGTLGSISVGGDFDVSGFNSDLDNDGIIRVSGALTFDGSDGEGEEAIQKKAEVCSELCAAPSFNNGPGGEPIYLTTQTPDAVIDLSEYLNEANLNSASVFDLLSDPDAAITGNASSLAEELFQPAEPKAIPVDGVDLREVLAPDAEFYTDPLQEARLIQLAAIQQTGRNLLYPEWESQEEQQRALYENSVRLMEEYDLDIGQALDEQVIANLTQPVMWYHTAKVDGEEKLVPQIYLPRLQLEDLSFDGNATITANSMDVDIDGDFTNTGNIDIAEQANVQANDIVNAETMTTFYDGPSGTYTESQGGGHFSAGNMNLEAENDIVARGGSLSADDALNMTAEGDVRLEAVQNHNEFKYANSMVELHNRTVTNNVTQVNAGEGGLSIQAGGDLLAQGTEFNSEGDASLVAEGDMTFEAVYDEEYRYKKTIDEDLTSKTTTIEEDHTLTANGADINTGGDLLINTSIDEQGNVVTHGDGSVTLVGTELQADGNTFAYAGDEFTMMAAQNYEKHRRETHKERFGGLEREGSVSKSEGISLLKAGLTTDETALMLAEGNINLVASDVEAQNILAEAGYGAEEGAGGSINIIGEEETLSTYEHSYKAGLSFEGLAKTATGAGLVDVFSSEGLVLAEESKTSDWTSQSDYVGSSLKARDHVMLKAQEDINVVGSQVEAGENLMADAGRDINVLAGVSSASQKHEESTTQMGISASSGGSSAEIFAGATTETTGTEQGQVRQVASQLQGGNVSLTAGRDITTVGSDLIALAPEAAPEVSDNIEEAPPEADDALPVEDAELASEEDPATDLAEQGYNVQGTVAALDSIESTGTVSLDAERDINTLASVNRDTLKEYQETLRVGLKISGSESISGASDTVENAQGVAGTLRSVDAVNGARNGGVSASAAVVSEWSRSEQNSEQTTTRASGISGSNIVLKSGRDQNHVGTVALVDNNMVIDAGRNLTIESAQDQSSSHSRSESAQVSLGLGDKAGVNAGASYAKNDSANTYQNNARFNAGNELSVTTGNDTTLSGALVTAHKVTADIGGDLTVESRQDTGRVRGENYSVSGGTGSVSVSGGRTKGDRAWVSEQSGLIASEESRIDVSGHTQVNGAIIDNLGGDVNLTTETFAYRDIEDYDTYESHQVGIGVNTGQAGQDTNNRPMGERINNIDAQYQSSDREQINRATVGTGVTVRSDKNTDDNSLANLNRDIDRAQEITRDESEDYDVYVSDSSLNTLSDRNQRAEFFDLRRTVRDVTASAADGIDEVDNAFVDGLSLGQSDSEGLITDEQAILIHQKAEEFGVTAFNTVGAVPQYISQLPPSGDQEGLSGVIGKGFDLLGTGGILPSDANNGGLLAQLPGFLGADDIRQKAYRAEPRPDGELPEGYMLASELPMYDDLPQASKDAMANMMITEVDAAEASTYQNFTNGMLNNLPEALANAQEQTGSDVFTLNYNPTHGFVGDLLESGQDKTLGGLSMFNTGASEKTGEYMLKVVDNQGEDSANFANHSQGNILVYAGLLSRQQGEFSQLLSEQNSGESEDFRLPSIVSYGSPVNYDGMDNASKQFGLDFSGSYSNEGDVVSEVLGGNKGESGEYSWVERFKRLKNIGKLGGEKYPYDDQGNPQEASPHSTYICKKNCGRYGMRDQ